MTARISKNFALFVGLGFFAFLVIVGYFTIVLRKEKGTAGLQRIAVRLATAEGMKKGAPVMIQGVQAGYVSYLHFTPTDGEGWPLAFNEQGSRNEGQTVIAVLEITENVLFYPNHRIITKYTSAISEKVVEINPGKSIQGSRPLHPLDLSAEQLLDLKTNGILPEIEGETLLAAHNYDDPLYMIASVIVDNRRSIRRVVSNVASITEKINTGSGTLSALINRPDLIDSSNELLKKLILTVHDAREGVEDTRESRASIDFLTMLLTVIGHLAAGQ